MKILQRRNEEMNEQKPENVNEATSAQSALNAWLERDRARSAFYKGVALGDPMHWRDLGPDDIWDAAWAAATVVERDACATMEQVTKLNAGLDGVAVMVIGVGIVAWFADPEQGQEWATDNHFGNWLMHPYFLDNKPPFTPEQIAGAEERAKKLQALFQSKPLAV